MSTARHRKDGAASPYTIATYHEAQALVAGLFETGSMDGLISTREGHRLGVLATRLVCDGIQAIEAGEEVPPAVKIVEGRVPTQYVGHVEKPLVVEYGSCPYQFSGDPKDVIKALEAVGAAAGKTASDAMFADLMIAEIERTTKA